jgi:hypothetical protein
MAEAIRLAHNWDRMMNKEGGKSHLDVGGGKYATDFRQHTIRQLPIFKTFCRGWSSEGILAKGENRK